MFQIYGLAEQSQLVASHRASTSGSVSLICISSCEEEMYDAFVVEETDKEDRDLDGVIPPAEAEESEHCGMFRVLETEFWAVHNEMTADLVDVVRMDKRSIKFEGQLMKNDWELQKTKTKLQSGSGAVLKAPIS